MNLEQLLSCALDIGEQLLISGAEISRAESSVYRICMAYGCQRADIFIITSSIVASVEGPDGTHASQSRRITGSRTDLNKVDELNDLSREICRNTPDYTYVRERFLAICAKKPFPLWLETLASALIAFAFTLFFGGVVSDALLAGILGAGVRCSTQLLKISGLNAIFSNMIVSFFMSAATILLQKAGLVIDMHFVIIGNIMLLIPGIGLTNAMRDMISGDMSSGTLRLTDAILIAAAIAAGYILAAQLLGGAV